MTTATERVTPQPVPVPNDSRPIYELVVEDLLEKSRLGMVKYKTPLQAFNGRDADLDAYQEALDLATYLRQRILEKEHPWQWLSSTRELQSEIYGYDMEYLNAGASLAADGEIGRIRRANLAAYLDWNVTAAVQELAEVREEFSWKPWAVDAPFVNRNRIIDEVVDALHFLGNILTGVGCTDAELEARYRVKQDINRKRQASGTYSAQKGGLGEGSDNVT